MQYKQHPQICCGLSHSKPSSSVAPLPSASVRGASGLAAVAPKRALTADPREERCDGAERKEAPREEAEREDTEPWVREEADGERDEGEGVEVAEVLLLGGVREAALADGGD